MDKQNNNTTRHLSVAEYFLQVQKEYLIADFRRKIYFSPKDKNYYTRVCGYKKNRIDKISERNKLHSIFNSEEKLNELRHELFDSFGRPKFQMSEEDNKNYYANGNEFSYQGEIYILDQEREDGRITLYSPTKEEYLTVDKSDVSRIL